MAENELDGFDNLDDLFKDEKQGGEAAAAAGGDIDKLLDETPTEGAPAGEAGGASDSELDSFFEDLSTIDDLEVAQEEAPAAPPPKAEPAAEPRAVEPAPRRPALAKPKKKGGGVRRFLVLLLLLAGAGGLVYWFFFPGEEVPWEVTVPEEKMEVPVKAEKPAPPPKPEPQVALPQPPPPPVEQAPPPPKPEPRPAPPAEPGVTYSIQVATCFFPSCVQDFQKRLKALNVASRVREKSRSRETLEIYSATTFNSRETAQLMAEKINRENRMEGHAYVYQDGGGYKISMGNFTDLGRANIVRDALNQRMASELSFATRVKGIPYKLHYVLGGKYGSRAAAEAALKKLAASDSRFSDAFIQRN